MITASEFVLRVIQCWRTLLVCIGISILAVSIYIALTPAKYTASVLLGHAVSADESASGSSDSGSSLGGLGALLGRSGTNDSKMQLFLTILKTERFAKYVDSKHHWQNRLRPYEAQTLEILNTLVVVPDDVSGTTLVSLNFQDPLLAKEFLADVFADGNEYVRELDRQRAEKYVEYSERRFTSEQSTSLRDALLGLLLSQERFLMLTKVDLPYAATLLDGPNVTNRPTSPRRNLLLASAFLVGLVIGIAGILIWDALVAEREGRGLPPPFAQSWGRLIRLRDQQPDVDAG